MTSPTTSVQHDSSIIEIPRKNTGTLNGRNVAPLTTRSPSTTFIAVNSVIGLAQLSILITGAVLTANCAHRSYENCTSAEEAGKWILTGSIISIFIQFGTALFINAFENRST